MHISHCRACNTSITQHTKPVVKLGVWCERTSQEERHNTGQRTTPSVYEERRQAAHHAVYAERDASQHLEEDIAQGVDFVDVGGEGDGDEGDAGAQGGYEKDVTKIHGGKSGMMVQKYSVGSG